MTDKNPAENHLCPLSTEKKMHNLYSGDILRNLSPGDSISDAEMRKHWKNSSKEDGWEARYTGVFAIISGSQNKRLPFIKEN